MMFVEYNESCNNIKGAIQEAINIAKEFNEFVVLKIDEDTEIMVNQDSKVNITYESYLESIGESK